MLGHPKSHHFSNHLFDQYGKKLITNRAVTISKLWSKGSGESTLLKSTRESDLLFS